jgi:hypothetical protein
MAGRSPGRAVRTRWPWAVALLAWAMLGAAPPASGQDAIAAKPRAAVLAAKPRVPFWALTPVGAAYVRNYEGLPASRAQEALGVHFRVTSIPVHSTRPLGVVDRQTPHDVNLAYASPIELQVSDGIAPPPAMTQPPQTPPESPPATPPQPPPETPPETPPAAPPTDPSQPPAEPSAPPPEIVQPERLGLIRDLEGEAATTAQAYLEKTGFRVEDWLWTPSDQPRGILITQAPKNVRAPLGSAVVFWVSAGPARPPVLPLMVLGALAVVVAGGGGLIVKRGVDRRRLRARRTAVHVSADPPRAAEAPGLRGRAEDRHALNIRVERAPGPPRLEPKDPP